MVRSVRAHVADASPPLIPPNPEPAQPPMFSILSPAAAHGTMTRRPDVFGPSPARALSQNVSAGALGMSVNASIPAVDPEVPSALSAEILSGPWPAPAASKQSEGGPFVPGGTGTLPPYYVVLNTTTTPPPTIEPLPNLTSEEEVALRAARAAAARDCILGMWSDWSSCEAVAGDSLKSRVQSRSRVIIQPQQPGGNVCDHGNMTEISQCLSREGAEDLQQELVPTKKTEDRAAP